MLVGLVPTAAHADEPLHVDCDVLAVTLIDWMLFSNRCLCRHSRPIALGELLSMLKEDPELFAAVNGLIVAFSGGTISFDSPQEAYSSIAQCGLIPLLNELVKD